MTARTAEPKIDNPERSADTIRRTETWIFDLDNTLYPMSRDIFAQVDANIRTYVADLLSLSPHEAYKVQKGYLASHGTTLRGLMDDHNVDAEHYLSAVHDIDLSTLGPDPRLAAALEAINGDRFIFTNADLEHTERVLSRLGVEKLIHDIFDIRRADFRPKPHPDTYQAFVACFGIDPLTSVMIEDMARNLVPAAQMGMTTVWLQTETQMLNGAGEEMDYIDHSITDLAGWLRDIASS